MKSAAYKIVNVSFLDEAFHRDVEVLMLSNDTITTSYIAARTFE